MRRTLTGKNKGEGAFDNRERGGGGRGEMRNDRLRKRSERQREQGDREDEGQRELMVERFLEEKLSQRRDTVPAAAQFTHLSSHCILDSYRLTKDKQFMNYYE